MDVKELEKDGLKRRYEVTIAADELKARRDAKLSELQKTARIPGFRPGKVPLSHLQRLYGQNTMAEVVDQAINETVQAVLSEREERPAYQPQVDLAGEEKDVEKVIRGEADLTFTMDFEVTPKVELKDYSSLKLERFKVTPDEKDIDEALANLAKQVKDYEDKDGKAEKGDRVVISFVGRIDGEEFEGGKADNVPLELGSGQFIPGFEEQMIGVKAGEERVIKVPFPEDYGVKELAGKEAEFTVRVEAVQAAKESEIDNAFALKLGAKDVDDLRQRIREQAETEFAQMTEEELKRDVLDALDEQYDFAVPEKMVEAEFQQIWHQLEHQMKEAGSTFADEGTTEEEAREEYRKIAERRVRLGLVIGAIGEEVGITVSEDELHQGLIDRARQFPGQEKEVFEFYRKNPEALMEIRGPIFERKVVEHIVQKADVTEREVSREELEKILAERHEEGAKELKKKGGKTSDDEKKEGDGN